MSSKLNFHGVRGSRAQISALRPISVIDTVESKLAQQLRQELIAATQALTPEQRLEAFLEHSQLMAELHEAGCRLRGEADSKRP
jgi:hypothetical protein